MGGIFDGIDAELRRWLTSQPVFFVASAPIDTMAHVNCSPKGNRQEFAVIDNRTVAYLDQTGSGAETAAHLRENGRITIMFCAFSGPCRIVRLYGHGETIIRSDDRFREHLGRFSAKLGPGARAIIVVRLERIADSCGYGVPLMTFDDHRRALDAWAEKKGEKGISDYQRLHNRYSIDGLPALDGRVEEGERLSPVDEN